MEIKEKTDSISFKNGNKWMYTTFITIVILLVQVVYTLSKESLEYKIEAHKSVNEIHTPYSTLTRSFVPRTELEKSLQSEFNHIKEQLEQINKRLDNIERKK